MSGPESESQATGGPPKGREGGLGRTTEGERSAGTVRFQYLHVLAWVCGEGVGEHGNEMVRVREIN